MNSGVEVDRSSNRGVMRFGGIVLCGGRSSRMGRPKATLDCLGRPLIVRMCRILSQAVEAVLVVAAPGQDLPGLPEFVRVVRDSTAYQGPLRGIADGLDGLPPGIEAAYVSSCDAPLLSSEWVRFMIEQLGDADIVVPVAHGRPHPLAGVYRRSVAATARRLLDQGRYRPVFLFDEHRTTQIPEDILRRIEPTLDSLENANTDEEYQRLLQRLRQRVESRGE